MPYSFILSFSHKHWVCVILLDPSNTEFVSFQMSVVVQSNVTGSRDLRSVSPSKAPPDSPPHPKPTPQPRQEPAKEVFVGPVVFPGESP